MRAFLIPLVGLLLSHAWLLNGLCSESPNIILILADDQGWTGSSLAMDGNRPDSKSDLYRTPHLERLASEGMRFSNGYAPAPNCSPTRMSIQTGKTAARLGATDIIDIVPRPGGRPFFYNEYYVNKPLNLPLPVSELSTEEMTIPELIKSVRPEYRAAHFGKWHMGGASTADFGFDESSGLTSNREGRLGNPDPKRTGEVTAQAVDFIRRQAQADTPFFLQVSYYAVHLPTLFRGETLSGYDGASSRRHINKAYAAMTEELDQGLGSILEALDTLELAEDTYVIYTSDNGAELTEGANTDNVPLARGKTHVWEGGIRVPLVIRGPGIEPNTQSDVPAIAYDFLPTIAEWVGAVESLPEDIDGGSLAQVLDQGGRGEVQRGTEALIWYYGAYRNHKHVVPTAAIRKGAHKLIWDLESDQTKLFDLSIDLSETTDLARVRPEIASELESELKGYFAAVGLEMPTRNLDYDPATDPGLNTRF